VKKPLLRLIAEKYQFGDGKEKGPLPVSALSCERASTDFLKQYLPAHSLAIWKNHRWPGIGIATMP